MLKIKGTKDEQHQNKKNQKAQTLEMIADQTFLQVVRILFTPELLSEIARMNERLVGHGVIAFEGSKSI